MNGKTAAQDATQPLSGDVLRGSLPGRAADYWSLGQIRLPDKALRNDLDRFHPLVDMPEVHAWKWPY